MNRQLIQLIERVTGQCVGDLDPDADLVKRLGVDSLTGLRILAAVEVKYGIRFPDSELKRFRSLRALARFIKEQGIKGE